MGTRLKNAPVFLALAQIRTNPIMTVSKYAADVQDALRKQGMPGYEAAPQISLKLSRHGHDIPEGEEVGFQKYDRFIYSNAEQNKAVIIDPFNFTFFTTKYETFEVFHDDFQRFLSVYNDVVGLSYIDRIGVRYLDAFAPNIAEPVEEWIDDSVIGIASALPEATRVISSASETSYFTETNHQVISRIVIQGGKLVLPQGIDLCGLKLEQKFVDIQGVNVTIDTDSFFQERKDFDLKFILLKVDELHKNASLAFRATVTQKALEAWQ